MLATQSCPNVTSEQFPEGSEPTELCTTHPGPALNPEAPPLHPPLDEAPPDEDNVSTGPGAVVPH
jgi:hypothetical protein